MTKAGYAHFPKSIEGGKRSWQRAVFWNKAKFEIVGNGYVNYPFQDAPYLKAQDSAPWVLLKHTETGKKFYF
ncbi:hypothetical protein KBC77_00980 [Candidatus Saccharibacteria bacterium]|nr:hypothetical protein [Candidatus Saccharibacteria bacterium]